MTWPQPIETQPKLLVYGVINSGGPWIRFAFVSFQLGLGVVLPVKSGAV